MIFDLTIFQSDDVTPLLGTVDGSGNVTQASFSTDPAHPRPYLDPIENFDAAEADYLAGTATIGALSAHILDKRTIATDQDSGLLTSLLSNLSGETQLLGRRCVVRANTNVLLDGVVNGVKMESLVAYSLSVRDPRERERLLGVFQSAARYNAAGVLQQAPTVVPRGTWADYGYEPATTATPGAYSVPLSPAVTPVKGFYDASKKRIKWLANQYDKEDLRAYQVATPKVIDVSRPRGVYISATNKVEYVCADVSVFWRPTGQSTWREAKDNYPSSGHDSLFFLDPESRYKRLVYFGMFGVEYVTMKQETTGIHSVKLDPAAGLGEVLADLTPVDFVVVYKGVPTEDWPAYVEGPAGLVLRDVCDGLYSSNENGLPPTAAVDKMPYDATVITALATKLPRIRERVLKQPDSRKDWLQKAVFQPFGLAPTLNNAGKLSPTSAELPNSLAGLLVLNNANVERSADWDHGTDSAVSKIEFEFVAESRAANVLDDPSGDLIIETKVQRIFQSATETDLGEKPLKIEATAVRDMPISTPEGRPALVSNASQYVLRRKDLIFDRARYGAQRYVLRCRRSDAGVAAARTGDWANLQVSWLPDYSSRRRGLNRLAQIIGVREVNALWREFTIEDAGAQNNPLGAPTVGSIVINSNGSGTITISAVPAGAEVQIDYAVTAGTGTPPSTEGAWVPLGARVTAAGQTRTTPILPPGTALFVRARSEAAGRRSSAWVTPAGVAVPSRALLTGLTLSKRPDGLMEVTWTVGSGTLGMRLYYGNLDITNAEGALASFVDVSAATGTYVFPSAPTDDLFAVEAEPWTGWTGAAVSGTAGTRQRMVAWSTVLPADWAGTLRIRLVSIGATTAVVRITPAGTSGQVQYAWRQYAENTAPGAYSAFADISGAYVDITVNRLKRAANVVEAVIRDAAGIESGSELIYIDPVFPHLDEPTGRVIYVKRGSTLDEDPSNLFKRGVDPISDTTAGRIPDLSSIHGENLMTVSRRKSGMFFLEDFTDGVGGYITSHGAGAVHGVGQSSESTIGPNILQLNYAQGWFLFPYALQFNPNKLYMVRFRYKNVAGGGGSLIHYVGWRGLLYDGSDANVNLGYQYVGAYSGSAVANSAVWREYTSWVRFANVPYATGGTGYSTDPRSPVPINTGTVWVRPMFAFMYGVNSDAGAQALVDYIMIQELDEDQAQRVYNTIRDSNILSSEATAYEAGGTIAKAISKGGIDRVVSHNVVTSWPSYQNTPRVIFPTVLADEMRSKWASTMAGADSGGTEAKPTGVYISPKPVMANISATGGTPKLYLVAEGASPANQTHAFSPTSVTTVGATMDATPPDAEVPSVDNSYRADLRMALENIGGQKRWTGSFTVYMQVSIDGGAYVTIASWSDSFDIAIDDGPFYYDATFIASVTGIDGGNDTFRLKVESITTPPVGASWTLTIQNSGNLYWTQDGGSKYALITPSTSHQVPVKVEAV